MLTKTTVDGLSIGFNVWTPDGRQLITTKRSGNTLHLYSLSTDGSGHAERLFANQERLWPSSWTRNGRSLVVMQALDVRIIDRADSVARALVATPAVELGGRLSPDNRWLAYASSVTGRHELYVTPFPSGGPRWQISTNGAREAIWSHDGRELFFRNGRQVLAVTVKPGATFAWDAPRVLFEGDFFQAGGPGYQHYDVSPDGKRFLMIEQTASGPERLNVIQGWQGLSVGR